MLYLLHLLLHLLYQWKFFFLSAAEMNMVADRISLSELIGINFHKVKKRFILEIQTMQGWCSSTSSKEQK